MFKGSTHKTFSPKKFLDGPSSGKQEGKTCIRTSSLFKNNPEIPELHRSVVKQAREQVFTPEAFQELGLHPHLISTINTVLKISSMTSVQKQSIPVLLEGRDALVRSQTGSGKTLAYCIPMVQSLQGLKSKIQVSIKHTSLLSSVASGLLSSRTLVVMLGLERSAFTEHCSLFLWR